MKSSYNKGRGNLIRDDQLPKTKHQGHSCPRNRIWMGTIWLDEDKELIKSLDHVYLIISDDDHTEDEQLHWHCLIQFANQRVHPRTSTAHWEVPRSIVEARQYCIEKGPNYYEDGNLHIACQKKEDWYGFVEECKKSNSKQLIDGPFSQLYAKYRSFAGEVHNQFAELKNLDGELENEWYYGPAGAGKTKKAWEDNPELYVKGLNRWWDGYHDQDVVLLDDWDPSHEQYLRQYLKTWADRYKFRAETKGSSMMIRPKKIIVTSNYSIDECFSNPEDAMAIKRRFKVTKFSKLINT